MSKSLIGLTLALTLLLIIATSLTVGAQANGYHIAWWTLDNGGGVSAADHYSLTGTVGQPDASAPMQGGAYRLTGGYWGAIGDYAIFIPLIRQGE